MPAIDLSKLSLDDLRQLQKDVAKAISGFEARKRREALDAAEAAAKQHGFSLSSLTGTGGKTAKPALPPKYAHPENPSVTWSGRGRQPGWIKEAVAAGQSLEAYLIGKSNGRKKKA